MASPFINAAIQRVNWSPKTKTLVALAVSAIIAVVYLLTTGQIADWGQLATVVPVVYGYQQLIFQFFLKNIATKFEALTSPGSLVVSPSESSPGKVNITTDASIEATGSAVEVDPPVQVSTAPEPAQAPIEIIKEDNVVG